MDTVTVAATNRAELEVEAGARETRLFGNLGTRPRVAISTSQQSHESLETSVREETGMIHGIVGSDGRASDSGRRRWKVSCRMRGPIGRPGRGERLFYTLPYAAELNHFLNCLGCCAGHSEADSCQLAQAHKKNQMRGAPHLTGSGWGSSGRKTGTGAW